MIHNAIKYGVQLIRPYTRFLGVGEDEEGVVRVGETLTPVIDQWTQPELAFLRQERLVGARTTSAAVAAELSGAALVNPADSDRIVVLSAVSASVSSILEIIDEATVVATYAGGVDEVHRDTRWPVLLTGPEFVRSGSDAAVFGNALELISAAGPFVVAIPLVLTPGFAAVVRGTVVNTAVAVAFAWRSRAALPGEL